MPRKRYLWLLALLVGSVGCGTARHHVPPPVPAAVEETAPTPEAAPTVLPATPEISAATPAVSAASDEALLEQKFDLYTQGLLLEESGEYQQARAAYEEMSRLAPESAVVHLRLAKVEARLGDRDAAAKEVQLALDKDPHNLEAHILYAQVLYQLGNVDEAEQQFQESLRLDPKNIDVYNAMGTLYGENKQYGRAVEVYRKLIALDPANALLYSFNLGQFLMQMGKNQEAAAAFEEVVKGRPNFRPAYLTLGWIYEQTQQYAKAITVYERLLAISPNDQEAHKHLAHLYFTTKQFKPAFKEYYKIANELDPSYTPAHRYLGLIYFLGKDPKSAAGELRIYLEAYPQDADIHYILALCLQSLDQKPEAAQELEKTLEINPAQVKAAQELLALYKDLNLTDKLKALIEKLEAGSAKDPQMAFLLSNYYLRAEDYGKALSYATEAVKQASQEIDYQLQSGVIYDKLNRWDEAEKVYRSVMEKFPKSPEGYNYLGYSYAEKGIKLPEAEQLIQKALALAPDNGGIIDSLGWVYYKQGKYQEALTQLLKASELAGPDPSILEHLGDTYLALGKTAEAIQNWQQSLKHSPLNPTVIQEKIRKAQEKTSPKVP